MDYKEFNDYELIDKYHSGYEEAEKILYDKYLYIVETEAKKYAKLAYAIGYDFKDLYQDALVGLSDALVNFRDDKSASLPSFITLCVSRRIQTVLRKNIYIKNKNSENISLESTYGQDNKPLIELIIDETQVDPLNSLVENEEFVNFTKKLQERLSDSEYTVLLLLEKGLKYDDIAMVLNKTPKQIDNAIQRIKNKIKIYLDK